MPAEPTAPVDLPTQAGMPVFHDDDEVDWLRARAERPEPPPPLEEPPPEPLFAPDPPDGEPVRRPRAGSRASSGNPDYWPWDASQDVAGTRAGLLDRGEPRLRHDSGRARHRAWSSGSWPQDRWSTGEGLDDTGDQVPGRSWFRLAMIVGDLRAGPGVAAVAAYQLGPARPPTRPDDDPTTSASPTPTVAEPHPVRRLVADDFDPQGSTPREENPESVPIAVDGDPATTWSTSTYQQNFGPAGLKTGVGLVVDLGATKGVRQVVVGPVGGPTVAGGVRHLRRADRRRRPHPRRHGVRRR